MSQELVARIRNEIERTGPITFARYMEYALYDPDYGYYTRAIRVGRTGDYLTAPEMHPIFGWVIARQLRELWDALGQPDPFTLLEYGPGTGTLALGICAYLAENEPDLLGCVRYCPIERSPVARQALVARFQQAGFGHLAIEPPREPVTGIVLANEVLDALPVHRLRCERGQLRELYVGWDGTRFVEVAGPLSTAELAHWLDRLGVQLTEGQTTELCLAILAWLDEAVRFLDRGFLLVLDYGYPVPQRYDAERFPTGTIRTYAGHTVADDPFQDTGERDITAHVDFTMLELAAQDRGLVPLALTTQAEFLAHGGLGELLVALQTEPGMTAERYLAARAAAFHLLDPGGMGRFRVALFGKQVAPSALPSGFRARLLTGVPLSTHATASSD
ncbi:SAM-dependent methyltransferase [Thermomicrobium sp. 4228-Ro]|uniref:class I SAM-dependent methyltransferase n=1 Tax=Thermomicrobium sp. 4228-Ro TaxID=2993937 RepID=UPI0022489198|nr:SAM-dependent methyltransferase [Thermomicrobium sp. 4228-Ro]MCX2727146.1 SAM-dependent methyltransferase [Thermomicrobium sp. 4228-Ro]